MDCILIAFTIADFEKFLVTSRTLFGRSISETADKTRRELSQVEKYLQCLKDLAGFSTLTPNLLGHAVVGCLIWGDERDMLDVFQICSMPFVVGDTVKRGVQAGVITGSLDQWQAAIATGLDAGVEQSVRALFEKILIRFDQAALGHLWAGFDRKTTSTGLILTRK